MTKFYFSFLFLFSILLTGFSQDTFSIVAVDSETGEIGSAGASCVDNASNFGGVIIINGIIPGRGGINGQARICINPHTNLNIGIDQMTLGLSPQAILDYLFLNDGCFSGDENERQYGIVDFDENSMPRAAAFTGNATTDHKGHRVGDNYAIAGKTSFWGLKSLTPWKPVF